MKLISSLPSLLASAALFVGAPLLAQHAAGEPHAARKESTAKAGTLTAVTEKDAAWAKKARQTYPLEVCVASDEKLGSMGKSPEYIYRTDGQPDRLVVLCCSGCEEDFMKEPAKFVAKLDAAAKSKSAPSGKSGDAKAAAGAKHNH